ncbi:MULTISPECIES: NAD(P)-binding domain-containing protein [unclassified Novosphingobium]|uniref:flavin-containing monooxygenase n=1 Tax=unclassified Novosphingobium TaxID=2644732 RepID=UPI000ED5156F|nr:MULTISPECIES: NAD(P)-binding domain-containing protein [unclassified Novosphingobium]HCF24054.1 monooxygenase [Novosphingobium sp.]HQV04434.1 NAD(P)-binding domain-containing protein [Novosphingobium sp.]
MVHNPALPRVCIIGAGCSGFTTAKRLKDFGIPFDVYEASDDIGGTWYYNNPNGMSACYQSLHIDTSKWRLAFEDYPVPADWPDYPHHSLLLQYFHDYVDHFGLREHIRFNTRVEKAERKAGGGWAITLSTGEVKHYDALAVANGHHWAARIPDYPGHFDGAQIHSHNYRTPFEPVNCIGKRVLVVGLGNSAMDVASELSQRPMAEKLFVSARRGVWIFPKYYRGQPLDKNPAPAWLPKSVKQWLGARMIKGLVGKMSDYGLPEPEIGPFESHGTVSGEFLVRAGSGDITMKGGIERLDGKEVVFSDGSREAIDVIVWATGYDISFPFFDEPSFKADADNRPPPLYKRILKPGVPDLFYMGLAQPLPTLVNFAEQQSKLVAAYLAGQYLPPEPAEMERVIQADEDYYTGQYYAARRHTIQLDFDHYVRALKKELAQGAKRAAAAGNAPPVQPRDAEEIAA